MGHNVNCSALRDKFRCPYCQRGYMMEWARNNHKKNCSKRKEMKGGLE